eukprot:symbB.v1.2.006797.t2/scaffold396.1/size242164/24
MQWMRKFSESSYHGDGKGAQSWWNKGWYETTYGSWAWNDCKSEKGSDKMGSAKAREWRPKVKVVDTMAPTQMAPVTAASTSAAPAIQEDLAAVSEGAIDLSMQAVVEKSDEELEPLSMKEVGKMPVLLGGSPHVELKTQANHLEKIEMKSQPPSPSTTMADMTSCLQAEGLAMATMHIEPTKGAIDLSMQAVVEKSDEELEPLSMKEVANDEGNDDEEEWFDKLTDTGAWFEAWAAFHREADY